MTSALRPCFDEAVLRVQQRGLEPRVLSVSVLPERVLSSPDRKHRRGSGVSSVRMGTACRLRGREGPARWDLAIHPLG